MLLMKVPQFLQNRIRLLETGMPHRFVSSDTGQGQAAESLGDLDAAGSLIHAPRFIHFRLATVVTAVAGQVVSDSHQHAPQPAIGLADDADHCHGPFDRFDNGKGKAQRDR